MQYVCVYERKQYKSRKQITIKSTYIKYNDEVRMSGN